MAEALSIPFYILTYKSGRFNVCGCERKEDGYNFPVLRELDSESKFADWWREVKRRPQNKALANGAAPRAGRTVFDSALANYGLAWGGNIDGFYIPQGKDIKCIIDCISVSCDLGNIPYADPAYYFASKNPRHGPKYEGWYSTVKLANTLDLPHALFTLDKKNPGVEHIGMAFIKKLSRSKLEYFNDLSPNKNVIAGLQKIKDKFEDQVRSMTAPIIE